MTAQALNDGLLDLVNRPRWYYTRTTAGLAICASIAGALRIVADGGATVETVVASAGAAGLTTVVIVGTVGLWASEAWRLERLRRLPIPAGLQNLNAPQVIRMERVYPADAQTYQPNIAHVMVNHAEGKTLHVSPEQLKVLKRRIRQNNLSLPVNSLEGFSSTAARNFRLEAVNRGFAEYYGDNQVRWTQEGAVRVMAASPAEPIRAR